MMQEQEKVKQFAEQNNMFMSPVASALDLSSEVGELCKELLLITDYLKGSRSPQLRRETVEEFGDAFYSLIMLSNSMGIELDKALDFVLEKHKQRLNQTRTAGSV